MIIKCFCGNHITACIKIHKTKIYSIINNIIIRNVSKVWHYESNIFQNEYVKGSFYTSYNWAKNSILLDNPIKL